MTSPRAHTARRPDQRGQTTPLVIGFVLVLLMVFVLVVDATAAFLRRQALGTLADGAALSAADGIAEEQLYTDGIGEQVTIDPGTARQLVAQYLVSVDAAGRYPGLSHTVEVRDARVVVRLAAPLDLPLPLPGVDQSTRVTATAAAIAAVGG